MTEPMESEVAALRQALEQQTADEPGAAESKFDREKEWGRCTIEHHNLVQSEPHKWPGYQTRLLYTRPQPAAQHIEHCLWARNGNTPCPHTKQAAWVGLSPEEIWEIAYDRYTANWPLTFARAIEALLRDKNGGAA